MWKLTVTELFYSNECLKVTDLFYSNECLKVTELFYSNECWDSHNSFIQMNVESHGTILFKYKLKTWNYLYTDSTTVPKTYN